MGYGACSHGTGYVDLGTNMLDTTAANWGWVLDQGATMIQTDYAAELIVWLTQKGRRNF